MFIKNISNRNPIASKITIWLPLLIYRSANTSADVLKTVPSNSILYKVLTGIGATHLEINTPRNSIIIEPNVPVIKGKRKSSTNKILGVLEGVYVNDIIAYLKNDKIIHKKIMSTPESFQKIKEAMEKLNIDMYNDYFLMYDECDKTAKDVDFRQDIILPLEDFFKFKNKAFVSATAVVPSDPRFEEQDFEIHEIVPDYDFSKKLNLISSNNPLASLEKFFREDIEIRDGEKLYIFFNSIIGIMSIIEQANLKGQCAIFCSGEGKKKIKRDQGIKIYEDIDETKFEKFNFLTSRYYSAVDIFVKEKPHVVIITDLNVAEHTMIDPYSDLIQIAGRFRNIELGSLTFISNHNKQLHYRDRAGAESYLEGCENMYQTLQFLRDVSLDDGSKDTLNEALSRVSYAKFLTKDEKKNYFMIDNFYQKEGLKSFYTRSYNWQEAFKTPELTKHFKVDFREYRFNVNSFYPKVNGVYKYNEMVTDCKSSAKSGHTIIKT